MVGILEVNTMINGIDHCINGVKNWYKDNRLKKCRNLNKKYERLEDRMLEEKIMKFDVKIEKIQAEIFSEIHPKFKYLGGVDDNFFKYVMGDMNRKDFIETTIETLKSWNEYYTNQVISLKEAFHQLEIDCITQELEGSIIHGISYGEHVEKLRDLGVLEEEIQSLITLYNKNLTNNF